MPKQTDITGTFRVPEEAWGRFWNTMLSIPGAEISPNTRVEAPSNTKRTNGSVVSGSTSQCLVLAHLIEHKSATTEEIGEMLVANGKAKSSLGNALYELKKVKRIVSPKPRVYEITQRGRDYFIGNCGSK